jgi:RNA polymerase sigma-70 factor (ECF subfamily)
MLDDEEAARDITQTVFLKAYDKIGTYDPGRRFFSWIYRIAVNEAVNQLGRRKALEPLPANLASKVPSPEDDLSRHERTERIESAIRCLSVEYRLVVVMKYFEDLSYHDMSCILGVREQTVKSRLHTARRRLARILAERGTGRAAEV